MKIAIESKETSSTSDFLRVKLGKLNNNVFVDIEDFVTGLAIC